MGKKSINLNRFSMIASLCLLSVFLCITLLAANGEQHTEHRAERKSMLLKMMDFYDDRDGLGLFGCICCR